jgi:hypothetical protein
VPRLAWSRGRRQACRQVRCPQTSARTTTAGSLVSSILSTPNWLSVSRHFVPLGASGWPGP